MSPFSEGPLPTYQVILDEDTSNDIAAVLKKLQRQHNDTSKEDAYNAKLKEAVLKNDFALANRLTAERSQISIKSRLSTSAVIRAYVMWANQHGITEADVAELIGTMPGRGRPRGG